MKQNKWTPYIRAMLTGFCTISLSVLFFFFVYRMQNVSEIYHEVLDILMPFIYGAVIAYLLRPMCNGFDSMLAKVLPKPLKKLSNGLAVILSLICGLLVVYVLIIMIVPQLISSIQTIWEALPGKAEAFLAWFAENFGEREQLLALLEQYSVLFYQEIELWVTESLLPQLEGILSGVGSIVSGVGSIVTGVGMSVWKILKFLWNLVIGLIVSVYLLGSRKRFAKQGVMLIRSLFKPRWADMILREIKFIDEKFSGFIDGKIVDSAIIGFLCYLGCLIFRFPNALLVSAIVGVTNVIPFFGPFIGAVPATLLIMIENPIAGLWFILFVFALQQLDGNVIGPMILGDRTGLASFWVLFAIVLGGGLWGVVGMIVAVPLFAVFYDIVKKLVHIGLRRFGQENLWEDYHADAVPVPVPEAAKTPETATEE